MTSVIERLREAKIIKKAHDVGRMNDGLSIPAFLVNMNLRREQLFKCLCDAAGSPY